MTVNGPDVHSTSDRPENKIVLEIEFYERETPPWAEWEMWREEENDGFVSAVWIAEGTAPSLEAAMDKAANALREDIGV